MAFKSDKQRKGFFASKNNPKTSISPQIIYRPREPQDFSVSVTRLKKLRNEAIKKGNEEFKLNGHPVLVSYAKYMIQYIEGENKRRGLPASTKVRVTPT